MTSYVGVQGARNLIFHLDAGKIIELIPKDLLNLSGASDDQQQPVVELKITGYEIPQLTSSSFYNTDIYKLPVIKTLSTVFGTQSLLPLTGSSSSTTNSPDAIPTLTIQASTSTGEKIKLLYDPWSHSLITNLGRLSVYNTTTQGPVSTSASWYKRGPTGPSLVFETAVGSNLLYTATGSEVDRKLRTMLSEINADSSTVESSETPALRIGVLDYAPIGDIYYSGSVDAIWDAPNIGSYTVDLMIDWTVPPTTFFNTTLSGTLGGGAWTIWTIKASKMITGYGDLYSTFIPILQSSPNKKLYAIQSPLFRATPPSISVSVEISRRISYV